MEPTYAAEIALLKKQVRTMRTAMIIGGVILGGLAIGGWTATQSEKYKPIQTKSLQIVDEKGNLKAFFAYDKNRTSLSIRDGEKSGLFVAVDQDGPMISLHDLKGNSRVILSVMKREDKWLPSLSMGVQKDKYVIYAEGSPEDNGGRIQTYDGFSAVSGHLGKPFTVK